jgi:voltage-gated potassium channel
MPEVDWSKLRGLHRRREGWRTRLWREWCFLRVVARQCRWNLILIGIVLVGGGFVFRLAEPEKDHSLGRAIYYTWSLIFGQPPEDYPTSPLLQIMFFVVPLVGLLVVLEGLVDLALMVRDRRRNERTWCKIMAASLRDHIILVGLGKLGIRTFRLLRELGEPVIAIERNPGNQFLEDIRRDGSPLLIGDARREALLEDANVRAARSVILATNDDLANLEIALDARRIHPGVRVVIRMFDQNMADKFRAAFDFQVAMSQSAISAPAFVTAALDGAIINSTVLDETLLVMQRWTLTSASPLIGRTIADVMNAHGLAVVQFRSGGGAARVVPPPDTQLGVGDELVVQGPFAVVGQLRRDLLLPH